jgi:hypothetical protein
MLYKSFIMCVSQNSFPQQPTTSHHHLSPYHLVYIFVINLFHHSLIISHVQHLYSSATTNTVSYTIKDCELYYLQSTTYAGKSGKGSKGRNLRDLSSKGSKSYGGEGIDVVSILYIYILHVVIRYKTIYQYLLHLCSPSNTSFFVCLHTFYITCRQKKLVLRYTSFTCHDEHVTTHHR